MSCYKDLLCEVEELREQLTEVALAIQTLRDIAAENGDSISTTDVLLQLSGLPHSTTCDIRNRPPTEQCAEAHW